MSMTKSSTPGLHRDVELAEIKAETAQNEPRLGRRASSFAHEIMSSHRIFVTVLDGPKTISVPESRVNMSAIPTVSFRPLHSLHGSRIINRYVHIILRIQSTTLSCMHNQKRRHTNHSIRIRTPRQRSYLLSRSIPHVPSSAKHALPTPSHIPPTPPHVCLSYRLYTNVHCSIRHPLTTVQRPFCRTPYLRHPSDRNDISYIPQVRRLSNVFDARETMAEHTN